MVTHVHYLIVHLPFSYSSLAVSIMSFLFCGCVNYVIPKMGQLNYIQYYKPCRRTRQTGCFSWSRRRKVSPRF